VRDDRPFNWAALNNMAAARATGEILAFLNNDIEAITPAWLDALCAQVQRHTVGAAGARLLYPDRRLQHAGAVVGLGGAAGHLLVGLGNDEPGYMAMAVTTRECSAVTGACLVTRRDVFDAHGGFDETLGVDLNDVDYCLRVQASDLRVLYEPLAELIHHESPSRGTAGDPSDIVRFVERWKDLILRGDPYLSPHLTRVDSSCALREPDEAERWQRWYAGLVER
jgi:O-antigen biosynthesis protein